MLDIKRYRKSSFLFCAMCNYFITSLPQQNQSYFYRAFLLYFFSNLSAFNTLLFNFSTSHFSTLCLNSPFYLKLFSHQVQLDDEVLNDLPLEDLYDEEKEIEKAKRLGLIMQLPTGTYTQSDKRIE